MSQSGINVGDLEDGANGGVEFMKALTRRGVVRHIDAAEKGGGRGGRREERLDGIEKKEEKERRKKDCREKEREEVAAKEPMAA